MKKLQPPKGSSAPAVSRRSRTTTPAKQPETPWTGMSLANKHAHALAARIGSPLSDYDQEFLGKVQQHMAVAAGMSSGGTMLAVNLSNQVFRLSNAPADDQSQELAAYLAIELLKNRNPALSTRRNWRC